jgi:hypothetical protein
MKNSADTPRGLCWSVVSCAVHHWSHMVPLVGIAYVAVFGCAEHATLCLTCAWRLSAQEGHIYRREAWLYAVTPCSDHVL